MTDQAVAHQHHHDQHMGIAEAAVAWNRHSRASKQEREHAKEVAHNCHVLITTHLRCCHDATPNHPPNLMLIPALLEFHQNLHDQ